MGAHDDDLQGEVLEAARTRPRIPPRRSTTRYEEQLRQLQNVKRGIADVATAKKRLEIQYTSMQQQVDKLDGQAKAALQANREDLAREALTRKAAIQGQLEEIMAQGQQLEAQQQKLVEAEKQLVGEDRVVPHQKEVIKAQYSAAEAQVRDRRGCDRDLQRDVRRRGSPSSARRTRRSTCRPAPTRSTSSPRPAPWRTSPRPATTIDRQLSQIQQSGQVDDELAKLKAELGPPEAPKEIETAAEDAEASARSGHEAA